MFSISVPQYVSSISASISESINSSSSTGILSSNQSASLEASKKVYNQGYSDGRTGYGLPASQQASANEYYLARGLNYSSADKYAFM